MSDNTSYTVEVYDPKFNWGINVDPEENENWVAGTDKFSYDTFSDAEKALKSVTGIYRSVRIKKTMDSVVALYQDGVAVE